jgi:hypothetical protein
MDMLAVLDRRLSLPCSLLKLRCPSPDSVIDSFQQFGFAAMSLSRAFGNHMAAN